MIFSLGQVENPREFSLYRDFAFSAFFHMIIENLFFSPTRLILRTDDPPMITIFLLCFQVCFPDSDNDFFHFNYERSKWGVEGRTKTVHVLLL